MESSQSQGTKEEVDPIITSAALSAMVDEEELRFAGLNDAVCTYSEGYIRQEVFSCLTCYEKTKKLAGICFACCNECHEDHEIVELFNKRSFKCDCGTAPQFPGETPCKLEANRTINKYNIYNDNFLNKWCTCLKPYPPEVGSPEYESPMTMCSVCENWYHEMHLELNEDHGDNEELICKACVTKLPFLLAYEKLSDVPELKEGECSLKLDGREELTKKEPKDFWIVDAKEFREKLCKCSKCVSMYDALDCAFLTDYEESVTKYKTERENALTTMPDALTDFTASVKNVYGADVAVNVSRELEVFKSIMLKEMKKVGDQGGIVTSDLVKRVVSEANEVRAKRARLDDFTDAEP